MRHYRYAVCGLQQTGPGGFDQLTGQAAAAALEECTYTEGEKKKTQDLLTHFILLFDEANKMPGYPGTSHMCVVEI